MVKIEALTFIGLQQSFLWCQTHGNIKFDKDDNSVKATRRNV